MFLYTREIVLRDIFTALSWLTELQTIVVALVRLDVHWSADNMQIRRHSRDFL
jgi:uncharacterized protein (DUF2342 family)